MCSGYASPIGKWVRWGLRAGQGNPSFTVGPEPALGITHHIPEPSAAQVFGDMIAIVNVTLLYISAES